MNLQLPALLCTLEHLAYIIECVADTIPGEARSEMDSLSKRLGGDPDLQFEESVEARETMVEAYGLYRAGTEQERREAVLVLVRLSRSLWKQVLEKISPPIRMVTVPIYPPGKGTCMSAGRSRGGSP